MSAPVDVITGALFRLPSCRPSAFVMGALEFRRSLTTDPGVGLIETYDAGRELAHRVTFRRWDY